MDYILFLFLRELSLMEMKHENNLNADGIETIQGYMNEHGQFVRLDDGVMVNEEDSSTVVVIIDSDMNEGITPEVADVMEVTCEEQGKEDEGKKRSLKSDPLTTPESKRKKSVIRVIKQED